MGQISKLDEHFAVYSDCFELRQIATLSRFALGLLQTLKTILLRYGNGMEIMFEFVAL